MTTRFVTQTLQSVGLLDKCTRPAKRQKLEDSIQKIQAEAHKLKRFNIFDFPGEKKERLVKEVLPHAINIKDLSLAFWNELNDVFAQNLSKYQQLQEISFRYCPNITDDVVDTIANQCPQLNALDVMGCENCTDGALIKLSQKTNGILDTLESLIIAQWPRLNDRGVEAISLSAYQLKVIDVSYCPNITNLSIQALAKVPKLEALLAVECENITDEAFLTLEAKAFAALQELDIRETLITDRAVIKLSQMDVASRLQKLDMSGTKITIEALKALKPFSSLKKLGIASNEIQSFDFDIEVLKQNQTLEFLNISFLQTWSGFKIDVFNVINLIKELSNLKIVVVAGLNIEEQLKEAFKERDLQFLTRNYQ